MRKRLLSLALALVLCLGLTVPDMAAGSTNDSYTHQTLTTIYKV